MKVLVFLFAVIFSFSSLYAQFKLIGQARHMNGDCIQLTADETYAEGIAYYKTKLDLTGPFQISFDIFFGEDDLGADGIVFVLHNDERGFDAFGTWGECMGYGRWNVNYIAGAYIAPSVAVEFDTYQNIRQNDPASDHIAYLENGTTYHEAYWNNNDANFNLEDGQMHDFIFSWNPQDQRIIVYLDGNKVVDKQKDLINEVFNGSTQVIWGFTASTGKKHNLQYFCLRRLALNK